MPSGKGTAKGCYRTGRYGKRDHAYREEVQPAGMPSELFAGTRMTKERGKDKLEKTKNEARLTGSASKRPLERKRSGGVVLYLRLRRSACQWPGGEEAKQMEFPGVHQPSFHQFHQEGNWLGHFKKVQNDFEVGGE